MDGAGGAGGTCCAGGGGYSGGGSDGQFVTNELWGENGYRSHSEATSDQYWPGGSYFEGPFLGKDFSNALGGMWNTGAWFGTGGGNNNFEHKSGAGGTAGKGGIVKFSNNAKIFAYNGNKYTDGTDYNNGKNECPIYCQAGIILGKYDITSDCNISDMITRGEIQLVEAQKSTDKTGYVNSDPNVNENITLNTSEHEITFNLNTQGIGSGAGYIEVSNGIFEQITNP